MNIYKNLNIKRNAIINTLTLFWVLLLMVFQSATATERVSQKTRDKLADELAILDLAVGNPVLIRAFKKESRLELWIKPSLSDNYQLFRTYPICYYSGGLGPKLRVGDKVTPEGFYQIKTQNLQPRSRFHLALDIGYPNRYDRYHGRTGSLLMIHGACDAVGCFAMSNLQIEEIYYLVEQALLGGQKSVPVHAFPFHLTDDNILEFSEHRWLDFWLQLKTGYDLFNEEQIPPVIQVENGEYRIESGL